MSAHLSPFRYPGGKTWLIPEVHRWLGDLGPISTFVEPFAGGASVGLSVARENLAPEVILGEIDRGVSAVWEILINGSDKDVKWLCGKITRMDVTPEKVRSVLAQKPTSIGERAFQTILHNRCSRGGIISSRSGLLKVGERGKGISSRWYPETLVNRINTIHSLDNLSFVNVKAWHLFNRLTNDKGAVFFVDPPYSIGTKSAGSRLYEHHEVDHEEIFAMCANLAGRVMMTYPDDEAVLELAQRYRFNVQRVPMRSTHHVEHFELLLTR